MDRSNQLVNEYFDWLVDIVCHKRFAKEISYKKLLTHLHETKYSWRLKKDKDRNEDGRNLRWRFAQERDNKRARIMDYELDHELGSQCSVLEMIIALAVRCEETIMDDTSYGDRTGQWFWGMITNLGLGSMTDIDYDKDYVNGVLKKFLDNKYESSGEGGLFTIKNCDCDLRKINIWTTLCWHGESVR